MPINEGIKTLYQSGLENIISDPNSGFYKLDADKYGEGINYLNDIFAKKYNLSDVEMQELAPISQNVLQQFKNATNTPRFIPKQEDFGLYYENLEFPEIATFEDKIAILDDWKAKSLAKASAIRPADAEDFKFHLEGITNSIIRDEAAKDNKTSWAGDKAYRVIEGFAQMGKAFVDIEWANRYLAENLPENPEYDEDISSMFAAAGGELVSQGIASLVTAATVGPQAIPYALTLINSARAMNEGYNEQFAKDGNAAKAMDVAVASIPGTAIESIASAFLFTKGASALTKGFADEFLSATTDAAKRDVLRRAIPSIGKEALKDGLSEGTVGAIGADFTTGYGRYLASGDSSYIPSMEDLAKGAFVEGLLGAGYSSVSTSIERSGALRGVSQELFQQNKEKQTQLFQAMKSGKWDEAATIAANENGEVPQIPTSTTANKNVSDSGTTVDPIAPPAENKVDKVLGFDSAARILNDAKAQRQAGNITEADRLDSVAASIRAGTYTMPAIFNPSPKVAAIESSPSPPFTAVTENDITLEDGSTLPKDKNIIFVKGISPRQAAETVERYNGASIAYNVDDLQKSNEIDGYLYFEKDGKPATSKRSGEVKISINPRNGYYAVEVPATVDLGNGVAASKGFSFIPGGKIKSYKKVAASAKTAPNQTSITDNKTISEDNVNPDQTDKALSVLSALETNPANYQGNLDQDVNSVLNYIKQRVDNATEADFEDVAELERVGDSIMNQYMDYVDRPGANNPFPLPRSTGQQFPQRGSFARNMPQNFLTNNFVSDPVVAEELNGHQVSFQGERGTVTVTDDGVYLNDNILITNNLELAIDEIEGLSMAPNTEYTLGPDGTGKMYKFENGSKVYADGTSVKIVGRRGVNVNPEVRQQAPAFTVQKVVELQDNPAAIVEDNNVEYSAPEETPPIQSTVENIEEKISPNTIISGDIANTKSDLILDQLNSLPDGEVKIQWLADNGFIQPVNGKNYTEYNDRIILFFKVGKYNIPFYLSTGMGGKEGVPSNKWYPFFGIGKSGSSSWINKGSEIDIANYYNFPIFKKISKILDDGIGILSSVDNNTGEYIASTTPEEINSLINFGYTPVPHSESKGNSSQILKALYTINDEVLSLNGNSVLSESEQVIQDNINNKKLELIEESQVNSLEEVDLPPDSDVVYTPSNNDTFLDKLNNFISTLSDKGKAAWDGKLADAVEYYKNGANREFKGSLNPTQLKRLDAIIAEFDSEINAAIKKEANATDEVSRELAASEKRAREEVKDAAKADRLRYSLPSTPKTGQVEFREAYDYISKNKIPVTLIHTNKVTPGGSVWKGMAQFFTDKDAKITINLSEISDMKDFINTLNEEIAHVIYHNPELKSSLDKIIAATPIDQSLLGKYDKDVVMEESIVKRVAELVDQYNERGTFNKIITAIKAYIKDTFGMELSNADLEYIAYRAINRASKNPNAAKVRVTDGGEVTNRFSYAGQKANISQFMRDSLDVANKMATDGKSSEEIRAITGWFPNPYDGKMRWEIPDNNSIIKFNGQFSKFINKFNIDNDRDVTLFDVLDHNDLYLAYPKAASIKVAYQTRPGARFSKSENTIYVYRLEDAKDIKGLILHEIQHWIQDFEGFSSGGNYSQFTFSNSDAALLNDYKNLRGKIDSTDSFNDLFLAELDNKINALEIAKSNKLNPIKAYESMSGEIEARDTEARQDLTNEQRLSTPPYSSENIAPQDAIVMYNQSGDQNSISSSSNNLITEIPEIDVLGQISGVISPRVKAIRKRLDNIIKSKLEQKLIIEEPENWKAMKAVNFQYLMEEDLEVYEMLLSDFADTRRRRENPSINIRFNQSEIKEELARLNKASLQGQFDFLQRDNEFLQDKDFMRDYGGDLDLVKQKVNDVINATDSDTVSLPPESNDAHERYIYGIIDLQDIAATNAKNRFDEMFNDFTPTQSSSDIVQEHLPALQKPVDVLKAKSRVMMEQLYNKMMEDPVDLSFKESRLRYYTLMSFVSDGYVMNSNNFISNETQAILNASIDDKDLIQPFKSRFGQKYFQGFASYATNIRRMGDKVSSLMFKLTAPFRAGIELAEMMHNNFVKPVLTKAQDRAEKMDGRKYTNFDQNVMGVYTLGKFHKASETPTEGMLRNRKYILHSIRKLEKSFDPKMARAMERIKPIVESLFVGIDSNTPSEQAIEIYERNSSQFMTEGMKQYVKDGLAVGEAVQGMAKFTTESVYGRHFEEIVNYVPIFTIENPNSIHVDDLKLQSSSEDQQLMGLGNNTNINTEGMNSTRDRARQLGDSKILVLNFNAMVEGRTRVNLLDYATASARREINNVLFSKGSDFQKMMGLLKDGGKYGDQGRISHLQKAVHTMWNNSIQNASYIGEFQGLMNKFTNLWSRAKLNSFYQLPAQFASNVMPYFIVNATNPKKIARFFEASNILIKYRTGQDLEPRLKATVERLLYAIESRQQDVFMDKTVSLDVDGKGLLDSFKGTQLGAHVIKSAREFDSFVEKASFWQFKMSDNLAGKPMLLAEYLEREIAAGRATDWSGLTFNEESYFNSIDEIERFIGIGGTARRGVWLNGKNGWMTFARNMISAFSSHTINNATNFRGEWFKLTNNNLSFDERAKSAYYMASIAAQSVTFTAIKMHMIGMFYNLVSGFMGEEENEEKLEAAYRQILEGNYAQEDKKAIQAEISLREKVRNEFNRVKNQSTDAEVVGMSMLKDTLTNSFIFPAVTDLPLNAIFHAFYDQSEAEAFRLTKAATIEQFKKQLEQAKAQGDYNTAIELQKQISQWESQEAIKMTFEKRTIVPVSGAYGGVLEDATKLLDKGAGILIGAESFKLSDVFAGLGILGVGQADINRISRLASKQEEYEKEFQEKLEKIAEEARLRQQGKR